MQPTLRVLDDSNWLTDVSKRSTVAHLSVLEGLMSSRESGFNGLRGCVYLADAICGTQCLTCMNLPLTKTLGFFKKIGEWEQVPAKMNSILLEGVEMIVAGTHSIAQFAFHRAHSIATNMFIMRNLAVGYLIRPWPTGSKDKRGTSM